jgi:uncharacterized membrane protein YgaE (UPF0421/DUF939 family)
MNEPKVANTEIVKIEDGGVLARHTEYMQERILTVAKELMTGLSPMQIAQKYRDSWGMSIHTIRTLYCREARLYIKEELLTDEQDIREDLLAKYNELFALNMKNRDYREARQILDSVSKLTQQLQTQVNVLGNIQTINLIEVIKDQEDERTQD